MAIPWEAFQVVAATGLLALVFEGAMWLLFYRNTSYSRQLESLERVGKRVEAAQVDLASDPVREGGKKAGALVQHTACCSPHRSKVSRNDSWDADGWRKEALKRQTHTAISDTYAPVSSPPLCLDQHALTQQNSNGKKKTVQRLEKELRTIAMGLQGTKFKIAFLTGASMLGGMWLVNKRFKGVPVAKVGVVCVLGRLLAVQQCSCTDIQAAATAAAPAAAPATSLTNSRHPHASQPTLSPTAHPTRPHPHPTHHPTQMPFIPPSIFTNLTHLGLPGDDMTQVSAAFFYATTSPFFRSNLQKVLGSAPTRTALKYLNGAVTVDPKKLA